MYVSAAGVGAKLPERILTNADLEALVDTTDEWIATRTGIRQRHVLGEGETLAGLAADAARDACEMAGVAPADLDMVIMCTSSPDDAFGSACLVQAEIGAAGAIAFDLTAACSGFVLGVINASQFIRTGTAQNVLVVGGDILSRYVDWRDRSTCILFGDGCGAVVLQGGAQQCGLLGFDMQSDGTGNAFLNSCYSGSALKPLAPSAAASADGSYANITMSGQDVFKFAVRAVPATLEKSLERAGLEPGAIDWLVMHQANQRILDAAAKRFEIPGDRVVSNIAKYGNTSAASIPIALNEAVRDGRIQPGDVIATAGFGAGLTWASALLRWG